MNGSRPSPLAELTRRMDRLGQAGLTRRLTPTGPSTGRFVVVEGQRLLLMAGNDYLGLSGHPRLALASARAAQKWGTGSGASRLVSGTLDCHLEVEKAMARFKGSEKAVFMGTGFMTNLAAVAGLGQSGDLIVSDSLNHASIVDACRLSRARVRIYPHCDPDQADKQLSGEGFGLKLLVTDSVFSMDGDMAPLPELLDVCRRHGALLVVDDAHATGVWGETGRGSLEHFGLGHDPDIVVVSTFSKALGGFGGAVCGAKEVIDALVHQARSLLYTTAPPPPQAAAARESLLLVNEEPWRRTKVLELSRRFREGVRDLGFTTFSDSGPIVPVLVGRADHSLSVANALKKHGIFAPAMRPPTVPEGSSRIRFALSAYLEESDIDLALDALKTAAKEAGL